MVSKLYHFKSRTRKIGRKTIKIPISMWKGRGYYYHRGGGVWTKYSRARDRNIGRGIGKGSMKHTHDRNK